MGNKSSAQTDVEHFKANYVKHGEENNKNYGKVSYYHNKSNPADMVMLKNQWSNSLAEAEDMDKIIQNRQNISHPNISQTRIYAKQDDKHMCSTFHKHTVAFDYHDNNLESEISKRAADYDPYSASNTLSEPEFWYLANSTVSADQTLNREGGAYHGNIQPSTLMLDESGKVKLLDNQLIHFNKNTYQRMLYDRNVHAPLSPNLLEQLKEKKVNPTYDPSREESWALGITSLCATTNTSIDHYYDWNVPEIKWHNVHDKLDSVNGPYSKQTHGFIESCLEETEERRASMDDHERFLKPYQTEINDIKLDFKQRNINRVQTTVVNRPSTTVTNIVNHEILLNRKIHGEDDFFTQKPIVIPKPAPAPVYQPKTIELNADDFFNRFEVIRE
jgi:hypothetical protein